MGKFSVESIFKAHDRMSQVVRKIEGNVGRFSRRATAAIDGIGRAARGLGSGLMKVGAGAAALGAGAGLVAKNIISTGADFEEAISAVGAVSLMTRDQIKPLEDMAMKLGATTKFTATQAANAMEVMARAGFKNEEIMQGITGVLAAAAAEGGDLAATTEVVASVLKGMGLEADKTSRVADVLAFASSKTKSSIGSLGESMKNVSPVARQFGIKLEDAVGMVALLQDVGMDASEAGTSMATMLTKLTKPSKEVATQMQKMGVTFKDAKGNMLAPVEIFKNMTKAAEKAGGNMDQVAFFADLVGLRGQKAALNLKDMFETGRATEVLGGIMHDSADAAERMSKLRMDNLKGDWTLLQSAIDGVKVDLFSLEGGPLRGIVQGVTKWIDANKQLISSGFSKFIEKATELGKIFGDSFGETFKGISEGFKSMFGDSDKSKEWLAVLPPLAKNLGQLAAIAVGAGIAFGGIAAGIVVLGSTIFGALKGAVGGAIDYIGGLVFGVSNWFADLFAIFDAEGMSLGKKALEIGKHVAMGIARGIKEMALAPINAIKAIGGGLIDGAKSALGIKSPSVPMTEVGLDTGAGVELGLLRSIPSIESAVADMFDLRRIEPHALTAVDRMTRVLEPAEPEERRAISSTTGHQLAEVQRSLEETRHTERVEVDIRDATGKAVIRDPKKAHKAGIRLSPSGAF